VKVVVAHNRYSSAQPSGENVIVDAEMAQLQAAGVEVVPFLRSSDEIATLPLVDKALLPVSPLYAGPAQRALAEILRTQRPDVVHLHNPYPLLSPWVIRTAHNHGVPVVHTVHNYRQVCAKGIFYRDGHICTDCVGRRFPVPAVVHSCYRESRAQSLVMATTLTAHRPTWRSVDRFIALTDAMAEHLVGYGIAENRIVVKPNSLPDPGEPAPLGDGFLFLGRLTEDKGIQFLLDAWHRHEVGSLGTLRIAGDGPLRPVVEAGGRADIEYLGALDRPAVRAVVAATAVVLAPSLWLDVLPTVILEALAAGRPVLGTALGGIPSLIGPAGWVVEPTVEAFAAALPRARAEAPRLAPVARDRYLTNYRPDVVTAALLSLYASLAPSAS
jgi:glycosyltransferase involved in cell wall biosynthesis